MANIPEQGLEGYYAKRERIKGSTHPLEPKSPLGYKTINEYSENVISRLTGESVADFGWYKMSWNEIYKGNFYDIFTRNCF